jgi:hypothetical protein
MSDNSFGEIIQPNHCRASASLDKTRIALTFECKDRTPITLMLPLPGAVDLQRGLAQALFIMTAKPQAAAEIPAQEQVAA